MKINVGPQARVIGTKRVSPAGTIEGLRQHAGEDLFLVRPSRVPRYGTQWEDLLVQARDEAKDIGRMALKEYRVLRRKYGPEAEKAARRLVEIAPAPARPAIRKADRWVKAHSARLEKRVAHLLRE